MLEVQFIKSQRLTSRTTIAHKHVSIVPVVRAEDIFIIDEINEGAPSADLGFGSGEVDSCLAVFVIGVSIVIEPQAFAYSCLVIRAPEAPRFRIRVRNRVNLTVMPEPLSCP